MGRTSLEVNQQPGGMFSIEDMSRSTGNRFYVDSNTGVDGAGYGRSPDKPFDSLAYALSSGVCTADKGDIIYVMPGHVETVTAAAGIACNIAGVSIIGLGTGASRPKIQFGSSTAATLSITASSVLIENLVFESDIASLARCINVQSGGDRAVIRGCLFQDGSGTRSADITVNHANADYCKIQRCEFIAADSGSVPDCCVDIAAAVDGCEVSDCWMTGDFNTAAIKSGSIHLNCRILRNVIEQKESAEHAIEFTAAATGIIGWNVIGVVGVAAGGAADTIDIGSCRAIENYVADGDADTSGKLTPPVT